MNEPLDELYLDWLYAHIGNSSSRARVKYWKLARQLFKKEFYWLIPNDDNRAEDGRSLRIEFIEDLGLEDVDPDWMDLGCSMLELLVGLSRRLSFLDEGEPRDWFWHLIENLGLRFDDRSYPEPDIVEEVLNAVIYRTYSKSGRGGLFPLVRPNKDQRDVEIWYQMAAYLHER